MIKRIDLFMPPKSQYQVLHHFTEELAEALTRNGVYCRVMEAERDQPKKFLDQLFSDPPQCTLSFNGLLPDNEGRFFCDLVRIPHVACLVDAPNHYLPLIRSKYTVVTCVDQFFCDFFQGMNFNHVLFMPHGVDRNLVAKSPIKAQRQYDVLMLASFVDFEAVRESWKQKYNSAILKALDEAAEIALNDKTISCAVALAQSLDNLMKSGSYFDSTQLDFVSLLDQLDDYIRGKDRLEVVKAIKDAKVHIFGIESHKWKKYLGHSPNVVTEEAVPYDQAVRLMQQSKIVLNSSPTLKNGAHERILAGIACGALVITNQNIYMENNFKPGDGMLFYTPKTMAGINEQVNEYLHHEEKRQAVVEHGRTVIMNGHTWDHRAAVLISELESQLNSLNASAAKGEHE